MLRETIRKGEQKRRRVEYRGIVQDARTLGVDRIHLWKVLTGRRRSKALLRRYTELKREKAISA